MQFVTSLALLTAALLAGTDFGISQMPRVPPPVSTPPVSVNRSKEEARRVRQMERVRAKAVAL